MFLGREKEIENLNSELLSQKKSVCLVYGKRRIGKSSLINEVAKTFDGVVINHLCIKSSYEGNLSLLCRSVALALNLPVSTNFATIFDLFDFLNSQNKKILVILDEYQYFKESKKENEVDSILQNIVDRMNDKIKLILCGSYISVMKELIKETNPLFGRFTKILHIEEFDYYDAAKFFPQLSVKDKIAFYSVFGGSPYVLSNLDYSKSLEENIINLVINQNSLLRSYIENIMLKEVQKVFDVRILEILGNGKKRYSEIVNFLGGNDSGLLDKQLKNLISMETIEKIFPINKKNDKKKQFYVIKDNLMRFYFTFIFANDSLISKFGEKSFFELYISKSLKTFISLRFEGIVNQYFIRQAHKGFLTDVLDFGCFWYDNATIGKNVQFDVVLKTLEGYNFYEVKFFENPMTLSECENEENQIKEMKEITCNKIGFVCSSGFDFSSDKYDLITGEELFNG